jgi:hypothetical protein
MGTVFTLQSFYASLADSLGTENLVVISRETYDNLMEAARLLPLESPLRDKLRQARKVELEPDS